MCYHLLSKSTGYHSAPCSISFTTTDSKKPHQKSKTKKNPKILQLKYSMYLCTKGRRHCDKESTEQNAINGRTATKRIWLMKVIWLRLCLWLQEQYNRKSNGCVPFLHSLIESMCTCMQRQDEIYETSCVVPITKWVCLTKRSCGCRLQ